MKVKQLDHLAKIVDKGNAIREAINDLTFALHLINSDKKTQITTVVTNRGDVISISDYIKFSKDVWNNLINSEIKKLRKEFKRLRVR